MKIIDSRPKLAREGWLYVGLILFSALLAANEFSFWVAVLFWVIAVFVLQFFRDQYLDRQANMIGVSVNVSLGNSILGRIG